MKDTSWIPDWRNPDKYPKADDLTRYQWMWEFLRRNPRYQEVCDDIWTPDLIFEKTDSGGVIHSCPRKIQDEFDFSYNSDFPHYSASSNPVEAIRSIKGKDVTVIHNPIRFKTDSPLLWNPDLDKIPEMNLEGIVSRRTTEHTFFTAIDLTFSLDMQLDHIKKKLASIQKERGLGTKRSQIVKFTTYLRILDAVANGESFGIIRDTIFDTYKHAYPDSPREDMYKKNLNSALRFRDEDYKRIMTK
ncbi:MAG: hypothetical protein GY744_05225 [Gammaproteobacteria bacterium]|nr:hypothetical protein [Gammaproteobacteria bacterium]